MMNVNMMNMMNHPQWFFFQQWLSQQQQNGFIPQNLNYQQMYNYFQMYLMNNPIYQVPNPMPNPMSNPMLNPIPYPTPNPIPKPSPNPQPGQNKIKELIPRNNNTDVLNMGNGPNIINITLNASTGNKTVINTSPNTTVAELLRMYTTKIGLSPDVIGKQIMFLYNGAQLAGDSKASIGSIFRNTATITVYDLGGIIGA
jgi:hypothetical protein